MNTRSRIVSFIVALVLLISTLPLSEANAASAGQSASTIALYLSDSYGDGWNGNKIAVYIDGVFSSNYTVSSGFSNSYSILYDSAKTYEFKWIKGNYATECSFEITLDSAVLLSATKTQCGNYTSGQSLLILDRADYDLNGEFAGGIGTAAEPYLVATKEQLNNVRKYPAAHFRQVRNIAFTAGDFAASGDYYNNGNGWEPLGNYDYPFYGYYDGNGFTISGLIIKGISTPYAHIGLFGYATGDIVNVNLTDIAYTITGNATVGGIVGYSLNSEIIGCSASGVIIAGGGSIGGIAGDVYTVKYCVSDVTIEAGGENQQVDAGGIASYAYKIVGCENRGDISVAGDYLEVGGIVGSAWTGISNCKNSGRITADGESDAEVKIGGIVGYGSCDIAKCENSGWVTGSGEYVEIGGIAGRSCGSLSATTVSECVNKGNILTVAPIYSSSVGGIVGEALEGTIRDCYTTDTVQLGARGTDLAVAGGIVGYVWGDATITNCYSLVNTVSVNTSAPGWGRGGIAGHNYGTISKCYYRYSYGVGYNKGSASATYVVTLGKYEAQSTYSGFDFTSVWKMGTGTYTYAVLRMESGHTHSLVYNAATATYESSGNLESWYCSACQTHFRNSAGTMYVTTGMLRSDPLPRTGTCGNGVVWRLTYEGVLTISGNGEMENYTAATPAPWYTCRDKVKVVIVQPGVTGIGSNAFNGCVNLTRVSLSDDIKIIGDGAFAGCSSLTQLRIPASVTGVGKEAFASITNLIVCFEGGAPSFGGFNVFANTTASAYYPGDDTSWTSDVLQSQIGSVTWTPYGSIDDVIIASGSLNYDISWTLSVGGKLTVTGRYSSTNMPDYYYSTRPSWEVYKEHITSVALVNIERIGNQAFYEYPALKSVNFGTVTAIGTSAFYNCTALENVFLEPYWGECTIGSQAFYNCTSLRQVAFPCRTTIGSYAFYRCTQLSEIYIADYGELWLDNDYGLKPASNSFDGVTATVYIPVNGWHVTDYGDFGGSLTWKSADFGPCGTDAFWTYDEATSTLIITGTGSVASYSAGHDYPWYGLCSNIKNVVFEDGITYIPRYTLEFMYYVQEVKLPNTLQIMACNAFNDCKSLNNLIIPASVTAFDSDSYFNRCDALTDVYYMGTAEEWAKVGNNYLVSNYIKNLHFLTLTESTATCTTAGVEAHYRFDDTSVYSGYYNLDKQPITQPQVIPAPGHNYEDGVCTRCGGVDPAAFIDQGACGDNLTWKLDKQGVLTIFGTGAMWDYSIEYISGIGSVTTAPWGEYYDSLKSLKLSDGITTIGQYAFYECSGFTGSLTIPNSVTTIRDNAFAYCSGFTGSLTIPSSVTTIGERAFYLCRGFNGNLTIPGSVTTISPYAFYWCSGFTGSLIIGEGVTTIGEYAFNSCNGFTGNLNLPASVTAIGNFAFSGCYGFTGSLIIPNSVTVIGGDAFSNCSGFDGSLGIPSSVTTIGMSAFRGCIGFTGGLTIPSSVTAINDQAFMNCIGFTGTLTLPSSIQTIGYGAFWGCKGLSGSLIIPDSVTTIGGYAFRDCSGITDVVIPAGVTAVGNYSFCNCSALAKATIYSKTAIFEDHVFQNAPTTFTIYGYAGSTAQAYATANNHPFVALTGVTLSGRIKVEGSSATATVVKLMQNGVIIAQAEIVGDTYSFTGVSAGIYDLVIQRANHLSYTLTGIPVGATDVDLSDHLNAAIASAALPAGDVNGDDCIDLQDIVLLTSADTFGKSYDEAATKAADINGDRVFDLRDLIIITSENNFGKSPVVVSFSANS